MVSTAHILFCTSAGLPDARSWTLAVLPILELREFLSRVVLELDVASLNKFIFKISNPHLMLIGSWVLLNLSELVETCYLLFYFIFHPGARLIFKQSDIFGGLLQNKGADRKLGSAAELTPITEIVANAVPRAPSWSGCFRRRGLVFDPPPP